MRSKAFLAIAIATILGWAAAVQAAKLQQSRPKVSDLPAFLRKEAVLGQ